MTEPSDPSLPSLGKYQAAEELFVRLLAMEDLDAKIQSDPSLTRPFESALDLALQEAYPGAPHEDMISTRWTVTTAERDAAALFLQRALYRINRLKLFWFDDLNAYANERSPYIDRIRERIEAPWQAWETSHFDVDELRRADAIAELRRRTAADVDPEPSANQLFYRYQMDLSGYKRLLEIASLDGLVEASQLSRVLGGASHPVQSMLTRLLMEEYGAGRITRKHSSYFAAMLNELGMDGRPEAYFDRVPWEVLASINQSFLLSERKRYFLRYAGGLTYFEISVPAAFRHYQAAAERLNLPSAAGGYWALHIREDERHGPWMLNDVSIPLAEMYPRDAWELLLGYDQQREISARASNAVARAVRAVQTQNAAALTGRYAG